MELMLINEIIESFPLPENELNHFIQLISDNCSEVLSLMAKTGKHIISGIKNPPNTIFSRESPINRKPLSSQLEYHNQLNKIFSEVGFTARRDNSIFCKSYISNWYYGTHFLILPFNGFNYTWCENAYDLTMKYDLDTKSGNQFVRSMFADTPQEFIKKWGFTNKNIEYCLKKNYEMYIHGRYIAIVYDNETDKKYVNDNILNPLLKDKY
jgi:hypothetical protein